ncbi:MAG: helix-turn-helix transcriptional regulator [Lachnospiraceae bacterium]
MAKLQNQKLKLIYLLRILEENTDSEHCISMESIISKLEAMGVSAERKSIYTDFDYLRVAGYDVVKVKKNKTYGYYLATRNFELPELKMMVDAVSTSKLVTKEQSEALIKKLEKLCSRYQADELQRSVFIYDRPKSRNESVFENIGLLTDAIRQKKLIDFDYYQWNKNKQLVLRENGNKHNIGPEFLEFMDGNYYLIAYDTNAEKIKHYRVDKMGNIVINRDAKRSYKIARIDQPKYSAQLSNMFSGEEKEIRLEAYEKNLGVIIDKFGYPAVKVIPLPTAGGKYICRINLQISNQLFGWLLGVSDLVTLVGPEDVVEDYQSLLRQNFSSKSSAK